MMVVDKTANRAGMYLYLMLLVQVLSGAKTDVSLRETCVCFCNHRNVVLIMPIANITTLLFIP